MTEDVVFEQRSKGGRGGIGRSYHSVLGSGHNNMQRAWGRMMLEEQQAGPCGWSRVRGGEREEGEGREGTGQVVQGLVGQGEVVGFYSEGGGSPGRHIREIT